MKMSEKIVQTAGRETEMLDLLKNHRKDILDGIHQGQSKIDCLDYLIYQLKKGR